MSARDDHLVRNVIVRIFGKALEPDEVTARLRIEPSYAHRPGEKHDRTGRPLPYGMWHLSSEHRVDPHELEEHISWILDQLEPVREAVQEFKSREGVQVDLYCLWEIEGNGGVVFTPAVLARVVSMNLALGVKLAPAAATVAIIHRVEGATTLRTNEMGHPPTLEPG